MRVALVQMPFAGSSFVADPTGRILARSTSGLEGVLMADIGVAAG
jgi:predicted amidohydrolase